MTIMFVISTLNNEQKKTTKKKIQKINFRKRTHCKNSQRVLFKVIKKMLIWHNMKCAGSFIQRCKGAERKSIETALKQQNTNIENIQAVHEDMEDEMKKINK